MNQTLRHLHLVGPLFSSDQAWITRVLTDYRTRSGVEETLAWAGEGDLGSIPDDSILMIGLTLAWKASTTSRKSRKEVIDKLLRVISGRPEAAIRLLELVIGVDDPYVVEAALIGCLGCCQQRSTGESAVAQMARIVYEGFFDTEQQPTHILLRYYASEICNRACSSGASGGEIDPAKTVPPWKSKPLPIWSEKTLQRKVAEYSGRGRAESRISTVLHSVEPNSAGVRADRLPLAGMQLPMKAIPGDVLHRHGFRWIACLCSDRPFYEFRSRCPLARVFNRSQGARDGHSGS